MHWLANEKAGALPPLQTYHIRLADLQAPGIDQ
jgi:hypothetical protein